MYNFTSKLGAIAKKMAKSYADTLSCRTLYKFTVTFLYYIAVS